MFFEILDLNRLTFPRLPERCSSCGWWQGRDHGWSDREAESWRRAAEDRFGRWGKLAAADGKLLGTIQFGPAFLFRRGLSCGRAGKDSVLLTCSLVADASMDSVRRSLVLSMLAELSQEGARSVEAFCHQAPGRRSAGHLFEQDFLRDSGFYPVRSSGGVQLMRLELGGVETARFVSRRSRIGILERIKAPARAPLPAALCSGPFSGVRVPAAS